jgi:hypothetical protein
MKLRRRSFCTSNYEVQFDLVLSVPEALENLYTFLKQGRNEESLDFILLVNKFKSLGSSHREEQVAIMTDLCENYLALGGTKELNIDDGERRLVLQKIRETQLEDSIDTTIFDSVFHMISRELQMDGFMRWTRSDLYNKLVNKAGRPLLERIAIDISQFDRNAIILRPDDFHATTISDKDIKFILRMNEDSPDWVLLQKPHQVNTHQQYTFVSKTRYTMGDDLGGMYLSKFTGVLPFSAKHVIESLVDTKLRRKYDVQQSQYQFLDYFKAGADNNNDYSCALSYYAVSLPWPFKKRGCINLSTLVYDQKRRCYIWAGKSTDAFDERREKDSDTLTIDSIYGYTVYEISEKESRYCHFVYANGKMSFDSFSLMRMYNLQRGDGIHKGILDVCKATVTKACIHDGMRLLDTLQDFKSKYMADEKSCKNYDL